MTDIPEIDRFLAESSIYTYNTNFGVVDPKEGHYNSELV